MFTQFAECTGTIANKMGLQKENLSTESKWNSRECRYTYCDVIDWRPSLLGNRSRNCSMDTLTTPVLLHCMVTNSGKASVSIVADTVLKMEDNTQS
jgi:hypothetical protein